MPQSSRVPCLVSGAARRYRLILLLFLIHPWISVDAGETLAPAVMLATDYAGQEDIPAYWISEKLDGVRARWDGERLLSRGGNVLRAPSWFVADFPPESLDGELWIQRKRFEEVSGAVRRHRPDPAQWRRIRFMVFDLPAAAGPFDQRLARLRQLLTPSPSPYIALIEQFRLADQTALMRRLQAVVEAGGEGLMLHRGSGWYKAGRSADLLKLKTYHDAEAVVIAHLPGEGKYQGVLGALLVEMADGRRFRLGTGFSDRERASPPAIGSTVTYRYTGTTGAGIPRFASFLRVREIRRPEVLREAAPR